MKITGSVRDVLVALQAKPQSLAEIAAAAGITPTGRAGPCLRALVAERLAKRSGKLHHYRYELTTAGAGERQRALEAPANGSELSKRALKYKSKAITRAVDTIRHELEEARAAVKTLEAMLEAVEL